MDKGAFLTRPTGGDQGVTKDERSGHGIVGLSHSDVAGRPDGAQVMVGAGFAYYGHMTSGGYSIIDVRDPREPTVVGYVPGVGTSWSGHLQLHDQLLLVVDKSRGAAVPSRWHGEAVEPVQGVDYFGGLRIYDVEKPTEPRLIGEMAVRGQGLHRLWYVGGKYAYASALVDGFDGDILMIIDVSEPTKPTEAGRYWLPGMWVEKGEERTWPPGDRVALHHCIVADEIGYCGWRDGGYSLIDVRDVSRPRLLAHCNWHPPFAGGTHTTLPLTARVPSPRPYLVVADEGRDDVLVARQRGESRGDELPTNPEGPGQRRNWIVDVRDKSNPVSVAVFPEPSERDYFAEVGDFGPHNFHENRPGTFQSSELVFGTYQSAGVRAWDLRDPYRPVEVGGFVPNVPHGAHSLDVFVDSEAIIYVTDRASGLDILQYTG